jgi:hypothetical protein
MWIMKKLNSVFEASLCLGVLAIACAMLFPAGAGVAQGGPTGEVHFIPDSKVEKSAGVWVDGQYAGYVDELKGHKTLQLGPGKHEIVFREAGYKDVTRDVTIAAGGALDLVVKMELNPKLKYSVESAELKIHAAPSSAAVYVDGVFAGAVHDFGGIGKSMLLAPGKHTIKISMPGYQDYVTQMDMVANQKYRIETKLTPGTNDASDSSAKKD